MSDHSGESQERKKKDRIWAGTSTVPEDLAVLCNCSIHWSFMPKSVGSSVIAYLVSWCKLSLLWRRRAVRID